MISVKRHMPFKKTTYAGLGMYNYTKRKRLNQPRKKRLMKPKKRMNIPKMVNKILARKMETKQSTSTSTDGAQITHNNFIVLDPTANFLRTVNGTADPMTGDGNRVCDQITFKGISLKMMIELNERFSDVTFRLLLVRSSKGDTPTRASLFRGQSGNKMLDGINTERYTIVFQKIFKMTAPNFGTAGGGETFLLPAPGDYGYYNSDQKLSRATRIVRVYIPGAKFGKGGTITYEDQSTSQVKFFDYTLVLFAYSNYTTSQDLVNVGRVNDYIKTMYYTDA